MWHTRGIHVAELDHDRTVHVNWTLTTAHINFGWKFLEAFAIFSVTSPPYATCQTLIGSYHSGSLISIPGDRK